jgi:hypothetical protein
VLATVFSSVTTGESTSSVAADAVKAMVAFSDTSCVSTCREAAFDTDSSSSVAVDAVLATVFSSVTTGESTSSVAADAVKAMVAFASFATYASSTAVSPSRALSYCLEFLIDSGGRESTD